MNLSVIIPAFNEEIELPICLEHVMSAFATVTKDRNDLTWELVVTDNNSTDRTAEIAQQFAAQVVFEPVNQIARARNAGATVASGEWLLFIDADSRLHAESIREMLAVIDSGSCGAGGCLVRMDGAPFWGRCAIRFWNALSRTMNWAAGSFVFCRSDAFREVGGFDEQYFAAEELYFSSAVKKWCRQNDVRFTILRRQPHTSSSRKFHMYSTVEMLKLLRNIFFSYGRTVRNQAALDFFYDGRR
jgi:glycosyltransferase involved in cell wall biosynthesis